MKISNTHENDKDVIKNYRVPHAALCLCCYIVEHNKNKQRVIVKSGESDLESARSFESLIKGFNVLS